MTCQHKDKVLESYFTKKKNKEFVQKFMKKEMGRHGSLYCAVTDRLRSYGVVTKNFVCLDILFTK